MFYYSGKHHLITIQSFMVIWCSHSTTASWVFSVQSCFDQEFQDPNCSWFTTKKVQDLIQNGHHMFFISKKFDSFEFFCQKKFFYSARDAYSAHNTFRHKPDSYFKILDQDRIWVCMFFICEKFGCFEFNFQKKFLWFFSFWKRTLLWSWWWRKNLNLIEWGFNWIWSGFPIELDLDRIRFWSDLRFEREFQLSLILILIEWARSWSNGVLWSRLDWFWDEIPIEFDLDWNWVTNPQKTKIELDLRLTLKESLRLSMKSVCVEETLDGRGWESIFGQISHF